MQEVSAKRVCALAPEDAVGIGEDVRMAAVIDIEAAHGAVARGLDIALLISKHRDICAAEPVDGLLGIAHRAELARIGAAEQAHELHLLLGGILELVDHHHLELAGKLSLHARVVLERLVGEREQVVVIEHRPIMFERAIFGIDLCRERHELIECARTQGEVGFGEKCRTRRTDRIDEALLVFAHAAHLLGELAACGVASTERRQIARGCEIGVERLDGRARCGAIRIGRGVGNISIGFIQIDMRRMRLHLLERLKPTDERRHLRKDGNEDGEQARKAHRPILRLKFKCLEQLVEGPCAADIFRRHAPQHVLDGEALEIVCIARDRESGVDAKIERMGPDDARAHAMDG